MTQTRVPARFMMAAVILALVVGFMGVAGRAAATPGLDACTSVLRWDEASMDPSNPWIDVDSPGVYCLDRDMASSRDDSVFSMIVVRADDVTIDCRGHRLAYSGEADFSHGITVGYAIRGVVIRNCRLSGFTTGIVVGAGMGPVEDFLVEDNVVTQGRPGAFAWVSAIDANGTGTVRRNRVYGAVNRGITAAGAVRVAGNLVDGVVDSWDGSASGIVYIEPQGGVVEGNVIRGVRHTQPSPGKGLAAGIRMPSEGTEGRLQIRDNVLVAAGTVGTVAFECESGAVRVADNVATGFESALDGCEDAGQNDFTP